MLRVPADPRCGRCRCCCWCCWSARRRWSQPTPNSTGTRPATPTARNWVRPTPFFCRAMDALCVMRCFAFQCKNSTRLHIITGVQGRNKRRTQCEKRCPRDNMDKLVGVSVSCSTRELKAVKLAHFSHVRCPNCQTGATDHQIFCEFSPRANCK